MENEGTKIIIWNFLTFKEYEAIVGKRPTPISADLDREYNKYREAHTMASESNATLHKAMQLHMGNLKMLSKPLNELQREIPSMEDIDEDSESNITEVQTMTKKVRIYENTYPLLNINE